MGKNYKAPGVYIEETHGSPPSIAQVETAIPAFIGYTEKAVRDGVSILNKAVKIDSLTEYNRLFGGGLNATFDFRDPIDNTLESIISISGVNKAVAYTENSKAFMYPSIALFYANGGGNCYIVSVGTYEDSENVIIDPEELLGTKTRDDGNLIDGGLRMLLQHQEPTIIVIPDAVSLQDGCYAIYQEVLRHCSEMQNRFGIFDIYDGYKKRTRDSADVDIITNFREQIGNNHLKYGAAYYPWLQTNVVEKSDIAIRHLNLSTEALSDLLPESAAKGLIHSFIEDSESNNINEQELHTALLAISPSYTNIIEGIYTLMNQLAPSAAMAGVYSMTDHTRGVWKAPANVSLNQVIKPLVNITHIEQEDLNVTANGKSINAIRRFPGKGVLVWGARTLDGNSQDWRYINVRRTASMIEKSITSALQAFTFEPNDANTWVAVKGMIINYLTILWREGALAGASPEDAFVVSVGLRETMTAQDILDGTMIVNLYIAMLRPAEFIVIRVSQQMQTAS